MLLYVAIGVVVFIVVGGLVLVVTRKSADQPRKKANPKEQKDSEFIQRLCYLMKIVLEHSSSERRQSSTREVIRIGEEISESGGFRYMIKIHEEVTRQTSEKVGGRLKALWKGIGDWRA